MSGHEHHMKRAIELALEAREAGNGPFGAVLVRGDKIVMEERNRVHTASDPTWHAELGLIRRYCTQNNIGDLSELTLYTSCEPCCMCAGSMVWARLGTLVYSVSNPQLASISPFSIGIASKSVFEASHHRPRVVPDILNQEGLSVFSGYRFGGPA